MKSRIVAVSTNVGNCDFCLSKAVATASTNALSIEFEALFDLYTNHSEVPTSIDTNKSVMLYEHLLHYWQGLFNQDVLNQNTIKFLVNDIGKSYINYSAKLFEEPVELSLFVENENQSFRALELQWDSFANDIKKNNRFFFTERLDTDLLQSIFERLTITYPIGTKFYRARISDNPLAIVDMGKPPYHLTTPGRANPVGIPYLYVSDSEQTTLYETRVALHESLTIGTFELIAPLNVVSLKNIANYGPFEIMDKGFDMEGFIAYRPYLQKLENELSKPVKKQDVHLDYLPTQFLCEYFKSSLGFDAVEYKSAMNPLGYNLAIFNDQKIKATTSKFYQINKIDYTSEELFGRAELKNVTWSMYELKGRLKNITDRLIAREMFINSFKLNAVWQYAGNVEEDLTFSFIVLIEKREYYINLLEELSANENIEFNGFTSIV